MSGTAPPSRPSLSWRLSSVAVMTSVASVCRGFLYGFNNVEITGLSNLTDELDQRKEPGGRERGLLTVCNHVSTLDDPLIWGVLPLRYAADVENFRWSLGAADICFKNKALSTFFSLGQVLPTQRSWHSPHGGLYQPTVAQAVNLLSRPPPSGHLGPSSFTTDGEDLHVAPASYEVNRRAWVHIFPEACCHQSPGSTLRYFKWGVSRLILESEPAPDFIPMFIHGTQGIMPEDRAWRFLPQWGQRIRMAVGEMVNVEELFGRHRKEWKRLVEKGGDLTHGAEAVQLRIDVAKAVRDEIERLREGMGLPKEVDETTALAETWEKEPNKRKFKSPVDGSLVNRH